MYLFCVKNKNGNFGKYEEREIPEINLAALADNMYVVSTYILMYSTKTHSGRYPNAVFKGRKYLVYT